jgi:hypothetical protein
MTILSEIKIMSIDTSANIYLSNGTLVNPEWLSSPWIDRRSFVKKSRKDYTCIAGSAIPQGSAYIRLEMYAGGCGGSIYSFGVSLNMTNILMGNLNAADENIPENYIRWVESIEAELFFKQVYTILNNA